MIPLIPHLTFSFTTRKVQQLKRQLAASFCKLAGPVLFCLFVLYCISINVGIGIGIAVNLFGLAKSLFLPFEVLYEKNIHGEVLCKYTC